MINLGRYKCRRGVLIDYDYASYIDPTKEVAFSSKYEPKLSGENVAAQSGPANALGAGKYESNGGAQT
ncbi:hypothetical protein H0H92_003762, partial [Tricholoma furcatifolium]